MYLPFLTPLVFLILSLGFSKATPSWRARLTAVALSALFIVAAHVMSVPLKLPPRDALDSLLLVGVLLAFYVVFFPRVNEAQYSPRIFYVAAVGLLLLWHIRHDVWTMGQARNLIAFFCLGLGSWSILNSGFHKVGAYALVTLPLMAAAALSYILSLSGGVLLSRMVLLLALFILAAVPLAGRGRISLPGLIPFMSVFLAAFAAVGFFYSNISPWSLIAAFIPFLLILLRSWLPLPRGPVVEALALNVLAAIPLGYVIWQLQSPQASRLALATRSCPTHQTLFLGANPSRIMALPHARNTISLSEAVNSCF